MTVKEALEWADDMVNNPTWVIGNHSIECISTLAAEVRRLQDGCEKLVFRATCNQTDDQDTIENANARADEWQNIATDCLSRAESAEAKLLLVANNIAGSPASIVEWSKKVGETLERMDEVLQQNTKLQAVVDAARNGLNWMYNAFEPDNQTRVYEKLRDALSALDREKTP